jgi:DNA transposition AAA+ family ATPase
MKQTTQKTYWHSEATIQFQEIITTLTACKKKGTTAMLIAPTGHCKTFSIDKFCQKNPEFTYRITINNLYKLKDIIYELAELTGAEAVRTNKQITRSHKLTLDRVVKQLEIINNAGGHPIIIIDEGENMEIALLKMIKGLYDRLKDHCGIVLIGTHRLVGRMLNINEKGGSLRQREALPELYRRFKAYHKNITQIDQKRDFAPFFKKYIPEDKGLQKLLCELCGNYGELHDYLAPALEEADEQGKPLTEDAFRIIHNIPKYN